MHSHIKSFISRGLNKITPKCYQGAISLYFFVINYFFYYYFFVINLIIKRLCLLKFVREKEIKTSHVFFFFMHYFHYKLIKKTLLKNSKLYTRSVAKQKKYVKVSHVLLTVCYHFHTCPLFYYFIIT